MANNGSASGAGQSASSGLPFNLYWCVKAEASDPEFANQAPATHSPGGSPLPKLSSGMRYFPASHPDWARYTARKEGRGTPPLASGGFPIPARLLDLPIGMGEPDSDEERDFSEWLAQTRGQAADYYNTKSGEGAGKDESAGKGKGAGKGKSVDKGESAGKKSDKKPGNDAK